MNGTLGRAAITIELAAPVPGRAQAGPRTVAPERWHQNGGTRTAANEKGWPIGTSLSFFSPVQSSHALPAGMDLGATWRTLGFEAPEENDPIRIRTPPRRWPCASRCVMRSRVTSDSRNRDQTWKTALQHGPLHRVFAASDRPRGQPPFSGTASHARSAPRLVQWQTSVVSVIGR